MPPGWTTVPVGRSCRLVNGRAFKPTDWTNDGLPIIRIQNLNNRDAPFNRYSGAVEGQFLVEDGELLFAWSGTPGTSFGAHIWDRGRAILNQHIFRLLDYEALFDKRFLRCAINERLGDLIDLAHGGAGLAHVTKPKFEATELALPPLNEQRRIVAKLEALQTRSRRAREALDAVPPLLEKLRQSILAAAFRGDLTKDWRAKHKDVEPASKLLERIRVERRKKWEEAELAKMKAKGKTPNGDEWKKKYKEPVPVDATGLPELPEGWAWMNLGGVFEVCVGATPSRAEASYWGGDVPWVSSGEVAFCRIRTTRESITKQGLCQTSTKLHPPGTVLLGMIGEGKTRGQAAILDVEACNNQNSAAIRVAATGVPPEYVYRYLEYEYERTRNVGSGNNQQALNKARVEAIRIVMAPLEEQRVLHVRLDELLGVADRMARAVTETSELRQQLDRAVLAKALRGELVSQDPNDEPAEMMLARVRGANGGVTNGPRKTKARRRGTMGIRAPSEEEP